MSTDDPVAEALVLLRERERELADETRRIQGAIAALVGLAPSNGTRPTSTAHDADRPSVRTMAVRLMEEENRDWSTAEILGEYQRRGTPVHGKDPNNALRAALADAKKQGLIVSTALGRYRAAKWNAYPDNDTRSVDEWATEGG